MVPGRAERVRGLGAVKASAHPPKRAINWSAIVRVEVRDAADGRVVAASVWVAGAGARPSETVVYCKRYASSKRTAPDLLSSGYPVFQASRRADEVA